MCKERRDMVVQLVKKTDWLTLTNEEKRVKILESFFIANMIQEIDIEQAEQREAEDQKARVEAHQQDEHHRRYGGWHIGLCPHCLSNNIMINNLTLRCKDCK